MLRFRTISNNTCLCRTCLYILLFACIFLFAYCSGTQTIGEPKTITISLSGDVPLVLNLIKHGTFIMGSPSDEKGRYNNETQHEVTLTKDFYIGKYEVTNEQYSVFLDAKGNQSQEGHKYLYTGRFLEKIHKVNNVWIADTGYEDHPVVEVSWYGAQDFCQWISDTNSNLFCRLPTEAEWEYACRAGTTTRFYWGEDPNNSKIYDYAWFSKNGGLKTHQVGMKFPNAWGLYDMSGNVLEWCQDWSGSYDISDNIDPIGQVSGSYRVLRGGAWYYFADLCRSANRLDDSPSDSDNGLGLRVVAFRTPYE